MAFHKLAAAAFLTVCALGLAGCGGKSANDAQNTALATDGYDADEEFLQNGWGTTTGTIWDIFGNQADPNVTIEVNKYIWNASLEVLNFLPIESVDPFTGVIVTGFGTPPGGGKAYRATVFVQDPALDARSLKLALQSRGGAVSPDTVRAVEDAILNRARQLRIRDSKL